MKRSLILSFKLILMLKDTKNKSEGKLRILIRMIFRLIKTFILTLKSLRYRESGASYPRSSALIFSLSIECTTKPAASCITDTSSMNSCSWSNLSMMKVNFCVNSWKVKLRRWRRKKVKQIQLKPLWAWILSKCKVWSNKEVWQEVCDLSGCPSM